MATGSVKRSVDIIKINSNPISVNVTSDGKGYVNTTYSINPPSGYSLISRQFMRIDDGGYNVIVYCSLTNNYIVYESVGSAPTLTGYVVDIYAKL